MERMVKSPRPTRRNLPRRTWPLVIAVASLVLSGLLLLAAGALWVTASTGEGWAWVGYYYAVGIAIFEVPAIVLAAAALRGLIATSPRGHVMAAFAAALVPCPLLLWGLWGLGS
jgi:hypothetical protein